MDATQIGGPAAIISWVVGAVAIMLLALIHAELGGMHAVNGGMARFPHYAFGSLDLDWGSSIWMWPWLLGLFALSLLSSFPGGQDDLHFGADMAVTAAFSLVIYFFALSRRSSPAEVKERIRSTADE
jgi:amino acid transporter